MTGRTWFEYVVDTPLRRPLGTLLAVVVLTALALAAWPGVRFEPDVSRLLPAEHPHVRVAQLLDDSSRPARTLWLLLAGEDLERDVPALAERLADSPLVAEVVTTREGLFREFALRMAAAPLWAMEPAQLDALAAAMSPAGVHAAVANLLADLADDPVTARELALRDPLGLRWLMSGNDRFGALGFAADSQLLLLADGRHALLQLRGTTDAFDADFATQLCAHVEAVMGERQFEAFGGYTVAAADQARIRGDFERASLWSVVLIALYLCWVMRGVRLPLLVQLPAMLSIVWAIPFGSLCFGALPTVAVAAVAVLCGLGVDFAIHYAARYRWARLTHDHDAAIRLVQRTTVPELLIDMATTAVTFLAIGAGTSGGLRAFGLLLAAGLVGSLLFTIFGLPVLLRFAGHRPDPERSWLAAAADRWLRRPAARRCAWAAIAAGCVGAVAIAVVGIPLSAEAESLRPRGDPVAAARIRIEARLGFATAPVVVLWPLERDASALQSALLALRDAGRIRFWSGLQRCETEVGRQDVARFRECTAGFVPLAIEALRSAGLSPEPFEPALEQLATRLAAPAPEASATIVVVDGERRRAITVWPRARLDGAAFAELAADLERMAGSEVSLHGGPTVLSALGEMLRGDLQRACLLAVLLAVVMVTWWLRSLRHGLLALVPSGLGLVVTLVVLHVLGIPLSMVSFVAVPFVLGIGVDEGVHLVGHFRHDAVGTGSTGVGIVRTSLGTVLGFSALMLAESPGLRLLGGIVAFGSTASMLSCLFVLAPLLAARGRAAHAAGEQP